MSKLPKNEMDAARRIEKVLGMSEKMLQKLDKAEFLQAWEAIFFLYQGLHPDETDHGTELDNERPDHYLAGEIDERLLRPSYTRSGWPVALVPLLNEAWRREAAGELADEELYPSDAQRAGLEMRNSGVCH